MQFWKELGAIIYLQTIKELQIINGPELSISQFLTQIGPDEKYFAQFSLIEWVYLK